MIARLIILFFVLLCVLCYCASPREELPSENNAADSATTEPSLRDPLAYTDEIDQFDRNILNGKGLIVLGTYEQSNDMLRFVNSDGSLWYEFTFYYDDKDGDFEYKNDEFQPFSFHPDYFTLALRLTGEDAKYYEVVVNEETRLKKYVEKANKKFKFVTWQKHILETFAIDFNETKNPVRQSPNGPPKAIDIKVDRYGAKGFDGDWLRLEWDASGNEHDQDNRKDSGWIRWREQDRLLIDWFYFA